MKNLILFLTILGGAFSFSGHATVVAEDTAEHTITFNFGRPTADVFLCHMAMNGGEYSNLDIMTLPNGDKIMGDGSAGSFDRYFNRDTAPNSSTLHLGSPNYGTIIVLEYCHDLKVPGSNPGGQIDNLYKILTPTAWSYFSNAQVQGHVQTYCPDFFLWHEEAFPLASNSAIDYTLFTSLPFGANQAITTDPTLCKTTFQFEETATGPRANSETAGNVTVGVKDVINFN